MSVIYLYGFVPEDVALPADGLLGVADVEVERLDGPGIAAVVGLIESDEFTGEALERNCTDVEWMARQGLRHEQVVGWFVDHATILPSRLLTLFSGPESVRDTMRVEGDRIRAELDRLAGFREWDLRVAHDPVRILDHLGEISEDVAELDRQIEAAGPGKRFLLEKKRKELARTEGRSAARRLARDLLDTLRAHTSDTLTLDPPTDTEPATLTAALLVDRTEEDAFFAAVDAERSRLEPLGLTVTLTGPWAPYRFMTDRG